MKGPHDAHRNAGYDEWTQSAKSGVLVPRDLADAIAIAFTAAMLEVVGEPELLALEAGEDAGGQLRLQYATIGASLGIGRETFRLTVQGARWIKLPELGAALSDPVLSRPLAGHLNAVLSKYPGLLDNDQEAGQGGEERVRSAILTEINSPTGGTDAMNEVQTLEARVRADVTTLDRLQRATKRAGKSGRMAHDWSAIRHTLSIPRSPATPSHGMGGRVRATGLHTLTGAVRDVLLEADQPMRSYRIKRLLHEKVRRLQAGLGEDLPPVEDGMIDAALARLVIQGEAKRVSRGVYQRTSAMRGVDEAD